jgi:hypothetical protein
LIHPPNGLHVSRKNALAGMTLRLPIDLRESVTEESRVKGDLGKIALSTIGLRTPPHPHPMA